MQPPRMGSIVFSTLSNNKLCICAVEFGITKGETSFMQFFPTELYFLSEMKMQEMTN